MFLLPLASRAKLGGEVRAVLGDGRDNPLVLLCGVVIQQGELVSVHEKRENHLRTSTRRQTDFGCYHGPTHSAGSGMGHMHQLSFHFKGENKVGTQSRFYIINPI